MSGMNGGGERIRLLLVESDPGEALRVRSQLSGVDAPPCEIVEAGLLLDAIAELSGGRFDLVLLSLGVPDGRGTGSYIRIRAAAPDTPVLVLARPGEEVAALKAVHAGAVDYLIKGEFSDTLLIRSVRYAIERERNDTALRHAARENARLATAIDHLGSGVVITDARAVDHPIIFANPGFLAMTGYSEAEVLGCNPRILQGPDTDPTSVARIREAVAAGRACKVVLRNYRKDGSPFWNEVAINPVRDENGRLTHFVGLHNDVTARIEAEVELATRNRELATLHRISALSLAADAHAGGFDAIVAEVARATGFAIVAVQLYDEPGDRLVFVAAVGMPLPEDEPLAVAVERATAGRVVRSGRPIYATAIQHRPDLRDGVLEVLEARTLACVPLVVEDRVIGALTLADRRELAIDPRLPRFATSLAGFIASLAERLRAQEALAAERARLAVTLRSVGEGIVAVDTSGRITLMNRVAERLSGWTHDEAVGRPLAEVLRTVDERTDEAVDPLRRVRLDGESTAGGSAAGPGAGEADPEAVEPAVPVSEDHVLIARGGARRIVAAVASLLRDRAGAVVGSVVVLRDVTRERQLEAELLKASKLESLGVLAGGIAHDFNNLLTGVLGHLSLLRAGVDAEKAEAALTAAEDAARRARELTQRLLTFSAGGAPIRERAALGPVIRDAVRRVLDDTDIVVDLSIPDGIRSVEIDVDQIEQAIGNILINARQAAPGGRVRIACENVRIRSGARERHGPLPAGDYVRISIHDDGHGIEPDVLPRIFDPYFSTRPGHSGLGLAAAYSIVRKHQGHIAAASRPGAGAAFEIYLPTAGSGRAEAAPATVAATAAPEPFADPRTAPTPSTGADLRDRAQPAAPGVATLAGTERRGPAGRRILVMDDDDVVVAVVRRMLERSGYRVDAAPDGEAALARYRDALRGGDPFDVVIMDLTIPGGMGGKEAIRELLAFDPDARAIVSSGYSNDPVMAEHRHHGFRAVIAKPFDMDELRTTIEAVIDGD